MATPDTNTTDLASAEILWKLEECFGEGERLMAVVREQLKGVGVAG